MSQNNSYPDPTLTDDRGRIDYDSTLVSPVAYVVECPRCGHRHETDKTWAYRCPECDKAIGVHV